MSYFGHYFGGYEGAWFGGQAEELDTQTRGGLPIEDAKRYREYLEKLNNVTTQKEVTQEIIEAAQIIEELPISIPQVKAISVQAPQINIQALNLELFRIQEYLDRMIGFSIELERQKREKDDELALLLMIN